MLGRLNLLVRHLPRSATTSSTPSISTAAAAATSGGGRGRGLSYRRPFTTSTMTSPIMPPSTAKAINTAACLIIGDEVLGGKAQTVDTNSAFFAKFCFSLGIELKRVEVIPDDENEIIEAVRRMSDRYDFVVTSGGIGPTHDDITYQSIAKAFSLPLQLHPAAFERMKRLSRPHPMQPGPFDWATPSPALSAKLRMVQLPYDARRPDTEQVLFVADDLWVPITVVNGNVHILPGVPRLFEKLLAGLKPVLEQRLRAAADPEKTRQQIHRLTFSTPLPESAVAGYLGELAMRVEPRGVKVGSYPRWGKKRNTVTLVGTDETFLNSLVGEVEENVRGRLVVKEDELDSGSDREYSQ